MKAIIDYILQPFHQPCFAFQPSVIATSSIKQATTKEFNSRNSFFVAKDFSKQAGFFFRVDSSQEYISEPEEIKKVKSTKVQTIDLNYSVGLKRVGKWIIFPLVFCWIILETAFEFIIDADEEEVVLKQVKEDVLPEGNYYRRPD